MKVNKRTGRVVAYLLMMTFIFSVIIPPLPAIATDHEALIEEWSPRDFQWSSPDTVYALSEQGIRRAMVSKVLIFPRRCQKNR